MPRPITRPTLYQVDRWREALPKALHACLDAWPIIITRQHQMSRGLSNGPGGPRSVGDHSDPTATTILNPELSDPTTPYREWRAEWKETRCALIVAARKAGQIIGFHFPETFNTIGECLEQALTDCIDYRIEIDDIEWRAECDEALSHLCGTAARAIRLASTKAPRGRENTVEVCAECGLPAPEVKRIDGEPYCLADYKRLWRREA
jgi:hypothetical protein